MNTNNEIPFSDIKGNPSSYKWTPNDENGKRSQDNNCGCLDCLKCCVCCLSCCDLIMCCLSCFR